MGEFKKGRQEVEQELEEIQEGGTEEGSGLGTEDESLGSETSSGEASGASGTETSSASSSSGSGSEN